MAEKWNIDLGQRNRKLVSDLKDALGASSYAEFIMPLLREKYSELITANERRAEVAAQFKNGGQHERTA